MVCVYWGAGGTPDPRPMGGPQEGLKPPETVVTFHSCIQLNGFFWGVPDCKKVKNLCSESTTDWQTTVGGGREHAPQIFLFLAPGKTTFKY